MAITDTSGLKMSFVDQDGNAYGIRHVNNKPRVSSMPYLYDIAEGNIPSHSSLHKIGYNPDVDNLLEDLWAVGGLYVFPAAGMQMEVVSSSNSDDGSPAGIGIRTVKLCYLDSNYTEQTEIITLNGKTVVPTVATSILRVQRFYTNTVGSNGVAVGNIDIRHLSNVPIYARISADYNSSRQSIWTVPAGKTLYIVSWQASTGNASAGRMVEFRLGATTMEGVYTAGIFQTKSLVIIQDGTIFSPCYIPIRCPAYTDVKISVISENSTANAICGGYFNGWVES